MKNIIDQSFKDHIETATISEQKLKDVINQACQIVINCINNGRKVLLFGNGGSAADAQHIAAEFTGRFVKERRSLPAIALTTDTSALTAIGNDYGFERVFERQVEGLSVAGDVLIGISTSGNSPNVVRALELGRILGCKTIGFSGRDGGAMNSCCDINIVVPSLVTARIQELHILIGHIICEAVDAVV
ncbi:D-sedoheptulose 7-phosphate isomerase [Mucilaginibacter polytrichastri]|uniref:Phosphoheptose isomerase n=1 Tax=Mucilaginibacter polytrichastri TaxID=1302689 RepID=A0A1Q5ZYT1_9SPHI|nr:D-sedoheptulose 7-phosphate isomerase [Mucilaginibacter polytrichastri]OKS86934.1 Phosphoheptose isomerase [Mucilaginibacter polytrichastri]SFS84593.1 phosphoheptose isomerase [Mucilaginibacter polytrichastri]